MIIDTNFVDFFYYQIRVTLADEVLPKYSGSMLRGAFGYALKTVCCINPTCECDGCFAASQCLYHDFYEEKNKAHKYRFLPLSETSFELFLYDKAIEKLPYVLAAVKKMIEEQGLGANRRISKPKSIYIGDKLVYDGARFELAGVVAQKFPPKTLSKKLTIHLLTPLRLKSNEQRIKSEEIDLIKICVSILHRLGELLEKPRQKYFLPPGATEISRELRFEDPARYSNRQKTKMNMGGFLGKFLYDNVDEQTANILQLGELIGVGKSCVFGLGQIKLEEGE